MVLVTLRVRSLVWFVTGAVVAVSLSVMFANAWRVDAAPGDDDSTFVPIAPCRLVDTRPGSARVGPSPTLGADDTTTFQATGSNGECTIPSEAVGLSLNVTALGATVSGDYLTVWPDGERPLASSLNPSPGAPPIPNAVTTPLSGSGAFNVYNFVGSVDVVIDVVGYYTDTSLQELAQRLAAVESDIDAVESDTVANSADIAANEAVVAALDAAQPFTVVSELISSVLAESAPTEIRSVTVTAPVDGRVAVAASGNMVEDTDGQYVQCGLMDSVTVPPSGERLYWQAPSGGTDSMLSATRVFDIAAGETATYSLVCNNDNGGTTGIFSPRVIAIFTPAA